MESSQDNIVQEKVDMIPLTQVCASALVPETSSKGQGSTHENEKLTQGSTMSQDDVLTQELMSDGNDLEEIDAMKSVLGSDYYEDDEEDSDDEMELGMTGENQRSCVSMSQSSQNTQEINFEEPLTFLADNSMSSNDSDEEEARARRELIGTDSEESDIGEGIKENESQLSQNSEDMTVKSVTTNEGMVLLESTDESDEMEFDETDEMSSNDDESQFIMQRIQSLAQQANLPSDIDLHQAKRLLENRATFREQVHKVCLSVGRVASNTIQLSAQLSTDLEWEQDALDLLQYGASLYAADDAV